MFDKSSKGQVLYIRHGETNYNKYLSINKDIQSSEEFLDSSLSEEGVSQAKMLSEKLKDLEIKFVFCSPLNRCLETTYIALESHPNISQIRVVISPYITEVVNGAQDIPLDIPQKKTKYNLDSQVKFDWNMFDRLFPAPFGDFYYLHFVDNLDDSPELKNILHLLTSFKCDKQGVYSKFLKYFLEKNQRPESLDHLFKRSVLFKDFLKQFREKYIEEVLEENFKENCENYQNYQKLIKNDKNSITSDKILVITHSAFIRMSTTEMAYKMDKVDSYPEDCYRPDNCEIISVNMF